MAEETDSEQRGPGGRPTKRTSETDAVILALLENGSTLKRAAASCGIAYDTLRRWREADPEFFAATEQARAKFFEEINNLLIGHARNGNTDILKFVASRRLREYHEKLALGDDEDGTPSKAVVRRIVVETAEHPEAPDEAPPSEGTA